MSLLDVEYNNEKFDEITITSILKDIDKNDIPAYTQAWRDIFYCIIGQLMTDRNKLTDLYHVVNEWGKLRPDKYTLHGDINREHFVWQASWNKSDIDLMKEIILSAEYNEENMLRLSLDNWETICTNILCDRITVPILDVGRFRHDYYMPKDGWDYDEKFLIKTKYSQYIEYIISLMKLKHGIVVNLQF